MSSSGNPQRVIISPFQLEEAGIIGTMIYKASTPGPTGTGLTLPQTATATLFTVTGGAVLVTSLVGIVTTAIGATATNLSLGTAPTIGTAETTGIGGPTAITSTAAGALISAPAAAGAAGTSLVAPGVPSSTVIVTNPYHGAVDIALSGFTLTAVFVNGVQVGTTNITYTVPQHGTISITYSVVGTWVWTGSAAISINPGGSLTVAKDTGFVVSPGTITWTTSASTTGAVRWYLNYLPVDTLFGAGGPQKVATVS